MSPILIAHTSCSRMSMMRVYSISRLRTLPGQRERWAHACLPATTPPLTQKHIHSVCSSFVISLLTYRSDRFATARNLPSWLSSVSASGPRLYVLIPNFSPTLPFDCVDLLILRSVSCVLCCRSPNPSGPSSPHPASPSSSLPRCKTSA